MTRTGAAARPDFEERTESIVEWIQLHTRQLIIGAIVLGALCVGLFLFVKFRETRLARAAQSLAAAEQAFASGNEALAQNELQRVLSRYPDSEQATHAAMLLAQLHFSKGRYQQGIDQLKNVSADADPFARAAVENLLGAGFEQSGKPAEAASHYRAAAAEARFPADRDLYLSQAARAHAAAGNRAEAQKIWTQLAEAPSSPLAAEARVRLGELEAKPAAKAGS